MTPLSDEDWNDAWEVQIRRILPATPTKNAHVQEHAGRSMATNSKDKMMSSTQSSGETSPKKIAAGPYVGFDIRSIRAEVIITTPEMATTLRKTCHFERQRDIKPGNVERLLNEAKRGQFVAGTPVFICVLPDLSMHIVNGNHTLEMVVALGHPVPLTFIYARVENLDAAGKIYATFDIHKMRTWLDGLRAVGVGDDVEMPTYVLPALGLIVQGFSSAPSNESTSRNTRFEMMKDYADASRILAAALRGAPIENQRKIRGATTFCVALVTAKYQPTAAAEFWGGMALDDGLARTDPRKALLRFNSNSAAPRTDRIRAAILAWNAFFKNQSLEYCKPNGARRIQILGTPFDTENTVQPRAPKAVVQKEPLPAAKSGAGPMFVTGHANGRDGAKSVTLFQG